MHITAFRAAVALIVSVGPTDAAIACRGPQFEKSYLGYVTQPPPRRIASPKAENADLVAYVEVLSTTAMAGGFVMTARILTFLVGHPRGETISTPVLGLSSCTIVPANGTRGLIVGRVAGTDGHTVSVKELQLHPANPEEGNAQLDIDVGRTSIP